MYVSRDTRPIDFPQVDGVVNGTPDFRASQYIYIYIYIFINISFNMETINHAL